MQSFPIPHFSRELTLPSSPLIEYIRLGLEHQALPLSSGQPHPSCFPLEALAEASRKGMLEMGERFLRYGSSRGMGPLRSWILAWLQREKICSPGISQEEIMLVPGCQFGFDLICQALLEPGDTVGMDAPCYPDSWCTLLRRGGRVLPLPVDNEGLRVEVLEELLERGERPKLIYSIPTYQNPRGCSLSSSRVVRLGELAEEYNFYLVLDDPYRFLQLDEPLRQGREYFPWHAWETGRIIWMSSFSKIIAPGLRSGWILAPREIVALLGALQEMSCISPPAVGSLGLFVYLRDQGIESQLTFLREELGAKRELLLEGLRNSSLFSQGCSLAHALGGTFLSLLLPPHMKASPMARKLTVEKKVATIPEGAFWPPLEGDREIPDGFLRLSYSWLRPEDVPLCVEALEEVIGS